MSARVSTSMPSDRNCSGLMYAGVPSAMPVAVSRALSAVGAIALAMPKSMTLHSGVAIGLRDDHVRRLDVAMNDSLLMRVLHRATHLHEETNAFGES